MAKNKRRTGKARPITSHQLFPAVVALWFGALFGLGSLAIRPSLIEQAVIASKLDLVIPAAAPPLGVTARILIALALSALGALCGAGIARRIARPKQEVRQRKRGAANLDAELTAPRLNGSVIEPPVRQPISALEELGPDLPDAEEAQVALGGRRRALAIDHDEGDFVPYDTAPLPGGHLQILDVGGDEFGAAAAESRAEPLDLSGFAETADAPVAQGNPADASPPTEPVALDWSQASPIMPENAALGAVNPPLLSVPEAPGAPARQLFQPLSVEPGDAVYHDSARLTDDSDPASSEAAQPVSPDEPRQIFGMPVIDGAVPREAVKAAGFQVSVFDTPEPAPLFDRPQQAEAVAPEAQTVDIAALAAEPLPNPSSLEMTDLAARLAESMRRRRAARELAAAITVPIDAPESAQATVEKRSEPEAAVPEITANPIAAPIIPAPPRFDPFANLPPIVVPEPTPALAEPAATPPLAMPAALRPLEFDDLGDDDPLDSLLPPRLITTPSATQPAEPATETADPSVSAPEELTDEQDAEEDSYGSLLELGRLTQANPFIRIDEPEADTHTIEPVVIFPGQASRPAPIPAQFAAPAPFAAPVGDASPLAATGEQTSFRRFDAPAQAGQGQPVAAAPAPGPGLDPIETERALRTALASLQRMSGAA